MDRVAVSITSQISLITSIAFLVKKYGSIDNIEPVLVIANEAVTDNQVDILTDLALNVFAFDSVIDIRRALKIYEEGRGEIKKNLFKYSKLQLMKSELNNKLEKYFIKLYNIDLLLIRDPSRFQELFLLRYINPNNVVRIEDGANVIFRSNISSYYKFRSIVKRMMGTCAGIYYRIAGAGTITSFVFENHNFPKAYSVQGGNIDPQLLLKNFKQIKQSIDLDKMKKIKLLFLGTYDLNVVKNSIDAIKKDSKALDLLRTKLLLTDDEILYKPHPKTFINMSYEDYSKEMKTCITTKEESLMMAEQLSIYMDNLKWVVSGAGSYSLFIISSMLEKVEPIMIQYKNNSHTKKQYDTAINKYVDINKVKSIIV